jgi:hypothetical protein
MHTTSLVARCTVDEVVDEVVEDDVVDEAIVDGSALVVVDSDMSTATVVLTRW